MTATAAIILAAGKGTRMKSDRAKVMFELAGKPMIQRVVDTAVKLNCDKICVVVGHQKDSVINVLDTYPNLEFAEQTEQLGTGHAIMVTEKNFAGYQGDIIILAGDVPLLKAETLERLLEHHRVTGSACTVLTAVLGDAGKYGRIIRDQQTRIVGIVEYKDATSDQESIKEINTGIWCFRAEDLFNSIKATNNQNAQKEYYLTDTLAILASQGKRVESVLLTDLQQASGINSQQQLAELEEAYLAQIKNKWLNNGVMIHNPATVYIGEEVEIEPDVSIEAHTTVKGHSYLERGCLIGPHCYLDNANIGNEAILEGYNIVTDASVHETEIIGWGDKILEETPFQS